MHSIQTYRRKQAQARLSLFWYCGFFLLRDRVIDEGKLWFKMEEPNSQYSSYNSSSSIVFFYMALLYTLLFLLLSYVSLSFLKGSCMVLLCCPRKGRISLSHFSCWAVKVPSHKWPSPDSSHQRLTTWGSEWKEEYFGLVQLWWSFRISATLNSMVDAFLSAHALLPWC